MSRAKNIKMSKPKCLGQWCRHAWQEKDSLITCRRCGKQRNILARTPKLLKNASVRA